MECGPGLVGREEPLARCRAELAANNAVLVTGPVGIGKSALLEVLARESESAGDLVLRSCPSAAEASLPLVTLYDLFAEVVAEGTDLIPEHLRRALEIALLRVDPAGRTPADQLTLRVAVLELLLALSDRQSVLVVLDDAHWLDAPSTEILMFVFKRLQGRSVRVLAAEQLETSGELRSLSILPANCGEVALGCLQNEAVGELLQSRFGQSLPAGLSDRISTASGGNPLFALELARAAKRTSMPIGPYDPLSIPNRLRRLLDHRFGPVPVEGNQALLLLAASCRLGERLTPPSEADLASAVASGLVISSGERGLHFRHPLLAELLYADATQDDRRACHLRIASLSADPLERVRHRMLAGSGVDPELADELMTAAEIARERGAPALAAEFSRLAAERTPVDSELVADRLLRSAQYAFDAGLPEVARSACNAVLGGSNAAARVGARLLLVELSGRDHTDVPDLLDAAATDATGSPALVARVCLYRADLAFASGRPEDSLAELSRAEDLALAVDDVDLQIEVLALRAPVEMQYAPQRASAMLARAGALVNAMPITEASFLVRRVSVSSSMRCGQIAEAVEAVQKLCGDVERSGRVHDLCDALQMATAVYERAGRCQDAYGAGTRAAKLRSEVESSPGLAFLVGGMAELNAGTVERALELAVRAVEACERTADVESLAYACGLRGRTEVLLGESTTAARYLGRGRDLLRGLGFVDPAMYLIDADLAEALVGAGAFAEAESVLAAASEEASRLDRSVVDLGLWRARATVTGLAGDPRGAADQLRAALPATHPYPLEIPRAHLVLGELERRARRKAAARDALQVAEVLFAEMHCLPWLRYTEQRLADLETPSPTHGAERRIIELVRSGATNREIAQTLNLSTKAVEGNLTRIYRRLGVRNRSELSNMAFPEL